MSKFISVDAGALEALLHAVVGPGHLIRELQVTRNLPGSPISTLVEQFNAYAEAQQPKGQP